ncbi:MAG: hypothetical protein KJS87_02935 [Alphaproteobacteria bacterium]|nr:hypothetical protein [Alphaproteobacteria bacterium]
MAVSARAADKLDAICIGATPEPLFAAASLAAAGKHVRVLDLRATGRPVAEAEPCLVDVEAAGWLNLVAHGLRYGAAAPLIAVSQDRSLLLWPEADATVAGLSALSERDAAAYPAFVSCMTRLAAPGGAVPGGLSNLLGLGLTRDAMMASALHARSTSLSRFLEEAFESPLLRGALAQHALEGTAVSPTVPGSARLLARQGLMSLIGLPVGKRQVAGGTAALLAALNSAMKSQGSLEVLPEAQVRQLVVERDAVQGVVLADGTVLRAPQVILGRLGDATLELLQPLPFDVPQAMRPDPAARIHYAVGMPPAIRGVGAAQVTSGASILLNPSLERLVRSHGAFAARQLLQDFCLSLRVTPMGGGHERMMWLVVADVLHVPRESDEGPWSGPRRERLVSAVTRTIEAWAPGFELSLKGAELASPAEPRPFLELQRPSSGLGSSEDDIQTLPDIAHDGVWRPCKGLWLAGASLSAGTGRAGLSIAQALGASVRPRVNADA